MAENTQFWVVTWEMAKKVHGNSELIIQVLQDDLLVINHFSNN